MAFRDVIGHDRPIMLLQAVLKTDRLAHAYLFAGPEGIGKRLVATELAKAATCLVRPGEGCGQAGTEMCRGCRRVLAGHHPDVTEIEPMGQSIKIEQVRALQDTLIYQPFEGRWKVAVVNDADQMTLPAANCLLKTLEEPPAWSLLVLVSARSWGLPATVRSRCHTVLFTRPSETILVQALEARRGIPSADARLLARLTDRHVGKALVGDLTELRNGQRAFVGLMETVEAPAEFLERAEAWLKDGQAFLHLLTQLGWWIRDVLVLQAGLTTVPLMHLEARHVLESWARRARPELLFRVTASIKIVLEALTRNVNRTIALEVIVVELKLALEAGRERAR